MSFFFDVLGVVGYGLCAIGALFAVVLILAAIVDAFRDDMGPW